MTPLLTRTGPRRTAPIARALAIAVTIALAGPTACGGPRIRDDDRSGVVVISIVGTNDLHGHIRALPLLGGFLTNLRRARADDGAVLLLDGGDMFQGTLESNLEEGASVIRAYEALGYDAVTIGNHEFDYGPVGEQATARAPGDDPRGALRARISEADFPFLSANILARASSEHAGLGLPSVLLERAGVPIGVIGVTTEQTLGTTIAANVADLAIRPLADAIADEARALRERGAVLVIVTAHAGGHCARFEDPDDLSACDRDEEIFEVAEQLPSDLVDAIVAGHSHQGVAHRVNGIPIVESFSYGVAFGRLDIRVDRSTRRIVRVDIHPPQRICSIETATPDAGVDVCLPLPYEGLPVTPDLAVAASIETALERAAALRDRPLGVSLSGPFPAVRNSESALGNFFTDLMLRARPAHDVAIVNGGGLRASLVPGPLVYGALYEAFPFDNRFATVSMTAAELAALFEEIVTRDGSFFSIAGLRVEARCVAGAVHVVLIRADGREVAPDETITVLTSDFLATGGDGGFAAARARPDAVFVEADPPIREAMVDVIAAMAQASIDQGTGAPPVFAPETYLVPDAPRVRFPGERPVVCTAPAAP